MSFLKAEWNDLAFINYEVQPAVLQEYLPYGTELDLWNGTCYLSLVGFMFENVRLLGMKIPFHTHFEEVNLRFYVKRFENDVWKRGVVFIKEIVPKPALSFVANTFYKEHYVTLPMQFVKEMTETSYSYSYRWKKNGKWNSFTVQTEKTLLPIQSMSETEFITEHYFGYSKINDQQTVEYEVKHPQWQQYQVKDFKMEVNFSDTYGAAFEFLKHQEPTSVILAKGSEVNVESKKIIS